MKIPKYILSNTVLQLWAYDQKGGEGAVLVGTFTAVIPLEQAVKAFKKAGGWKCKIMSIELNRVERGPETYYRLKR